MNVAQNKVLQKVLQKNDQLSTEKAKYANLQYNKTKMP